MRFDLVMFYGVISTNSRWITTDDFSIVEEAITFFAAEPPVSISLTTIALLVTDSLDEADQFRACQDAYWNSISEHSKIIILGRRGIDVLRIFKFSGLGLLLKYSCDKITKFHKHTWAKELNYFQQDIPILIKLKSCPFHPDWITQIQSILVPLDLNYTEELASSVNEDDNEQHSLSLRRTSSFQDSDSKRQK
ncbi:uncharacterized protein EV154DRAFT_586939 [Mucor mucedo]|uniref:uncharacterized protein n=1 Tax=Mucor mucedo TaxID=29922 RepID=UPI0022203887|nr:uncharacterized protein EV154DRAFT_586939 [Mucor mucedo]KAI7863395.1 hypothetical protein EV154DRAFT_586939 [Mucor mucedo]